MAPQKQTMKKKEADIEITPLISIHDLDVQGVPTPPGMKKLFVSYNILTLTTGQMGFGNTVAMYNKEAYAEANIEKFLADVQKSIAMAIEDKTGEKCTAQVLFFR